MKTEQFNINGYTATVHIPNNPNRRWIWKTEFFYAFDKAEQVLFNQGYTRVYYEISDKYGSPKAVKLMNEFYIELKKRHDFLDDKCTIWGFSRGGLYAFNYTLKYPNTIKGMYLDAPVLDLRTWPRKEEKYNEIFLRNQVKEEYGFKNEEDYENYNGYPVNNFDEYFKLNIPTLLVAGNNDLTVDFTKNSELMIEYCKNNKYNLTYYIKNGEGHHPHSFGNNNGLDMYGKPYSKQFNVYSSEFNETNKTTFKLIDNDEKYIINFIKKLYKD